MGFHAANTTIDYYRKRCAAKEIVVALLRDTGIGAWKCGEGRLRWKKRKKEKTYSALLSARGDRMA